MSMLNPILEKIKASRERAVASKARMVTYPARAVGMRLRPYQYEDVAWLRERKKAILGWAPGLGKTVGATEAAVLPALVACPLNLVEHWREFLEEHYPSDRVVVAAYGDMLKRTAAMEKPFEWLIVTHDMFRSFAMPRTQTLIIDEIHHFRNREAARSKPANVQCVLTPYVFGLTATPVYKDVGDLWHQLHMMDPVKWDNYYRFIDRYAVTYKTGFGAAKVARVRNEKVLKEDIAPYIRERTYKEVGMFLPDRIDKHVILKMDPLYKKTVYDQLRDYYRLELDDEIKRFENAGAVLHQLRKVTITEEKLATVKSLIEEIPDEKPVIVFVWYKETAAELATALDAVVLTGDMPASIRREYALSGGPEKKRVRVATMASISEGIDLSEARTVIFLEEDYVPGKNYQAMTRVQRHSTTGEQAPVLAYWIRYADTIDEVVHKTAISRTTGNALQVLREALGV